MAGALSSEATKSIPIDFSSMESKLESHTCSNGCSDFVVDQPVSIPVVDLRDPNAMKTINLACEELGVFQLKNHGIPLSLLKDVDDEIKHLFSLPAEQKEKAFRPPGPSTGYGLPPISLFSPKVMWHEGFLIMDSCYDDAKRMLPEHDHAHFCETMEEIRKQLKMVAEKVTSVILELLGVRGEEEKWVKTDDYLLQINNYLSYPEPDQAIGLAPHTDASIITFLHQTQVESKTGSEIRTEDQTCGLQLFKEGLGWVPIHLEPDVFLVIVGDVLEILSNGRFKSALHRATVSKTAHRHSYAFFHRASPEALLSPFDSPPRFRALTLREYDAHKVKDPLNALASISI